MGLFGIILRNVNLEKKDKEKIHELIKHSEKKQLKNGNYENKKETKNDYEKRH
jgi:hypothetical protein